MDVVDFIQAATAAAFLTNLIVGGVKRGWVTMPAAATVSLAFIAAVGSQFLLLTAKDVTFTRPIVALAVIVGIVAWGLSIGQVEVQRKADRVEVKIQTALDSPAGTTRAQLDKEIEKQN